MTQDEIQQAAIGSPVAGAAQALQVVRVGGAAPGRGPRLFCAPHAGGSAASFEGWAESIGPGVELYSADLPGRGSRVGQAPIESMEVVVGQWVGALLPLLDRPYALFGHSFGALVAYEIARRLCAAGQPPPAALIVAGPAPHMPRGIPPMAALSDEAFVAALEHLGGTPRAVLEDRGLMQLLLPSLRADLSMFERYDIADSDAEPTLPCPLVACGGDRDPQVRFAQVLEWRRYTRHRFECRAFGGEHFFPFTNPGFAQVLSEYLDAFLRPQASE